MKVEGDEERGAFGPLSFKGIVGASVIVADGINVVVVVGGEREVAGLRVLDAVEVRPTPPPIVDEAVPDILACALVDGSDLMWMSQWPKMAVDVDSRTLREGRCCLLESLASRAVGCVLALGESDDVEDEVGEHWKA